MSARGVSVAVMAAVLLAWAGWTHAGMPTVTHDGRVYLELTRVAA